MNVAELRARLDGLPSGALVAVRTCEGDEIDRTVEVTSVVHAQAEAPGADVVVLIGDLEEIEP